MAGGHRPQDTCQGGSNRLSAAAAGSTRAAALAAAHCQIDVSPLVSRPFSTTTAVSSATAVIRHLRTGPAQAKPPQQPLSACERDDERLGAYLRAPTPQDSLSVPLDRAKCHSDRAVRPLRCSRRRPRRADHHRHRVAVGRAAARRGGDNLILRVGMVMVM